MAAQASRERAVRALGTGNAVNTYRLAA
jgi:hypothetical protein